MTGTAQSCRSELKSIYGVDVCTIPTARPCRRMLLPPTLFRSTKDKLRGLIRETSETIGAGRSVLIGTSHIDQSLAIAAEFSRAAIAFELLNGVQDADESQIIAGSGCPGAVTVATHLAGRGTDIRLAPTVAQAGGMHVIGWEHHPLARVDRQLIGRGARQGDPGTARFYLSPDDQFVSQHAPYLASSIIRCIDDGGDATHLVRAVRSAQDRNETNQRRGRYQLMKQSDDAGAPQTRQSVSARYTVIE